MGTLQQTAARALKETKWGGKYAQWEVSVNFLIDSVASVLVYSTLPGGRRGQASSQRFREATVKKGRGIQSECCLFRVLEGRGTRAFPFALVPRVISFPTHVVPFEIQMSRKAGCIFKMAENK